MDWRAERDKDTKKNRECHNEEMRRPCGVLDLGSTGTESGKTMLSVRSLIFLGLSLAYVLACKILSA